VRERVLRGLLSTFIIHRDMRRKNVFAFFSDDAPQDVTVTNTYWNGKTSRITLTGDINVNLANTADGTAEFEELIVPGQMIVVSNIGATDGATVTVTPDPQGDEDSDVVTITAGESATFMYLGFEDKFVVIGQTSTSA